MYYNDRQRGTAVSHVIQALWLLYLGYMGAKINHQYITGHSVDKCVQTHIHSQLYVMKRFLFGSFAVFLTV